MLHAEPEAQTFLIRVWMEDSANGTAGHMWRGHITHLPDEQRRYIQSFAEIEEFIDGYLHWQRPSS